MFLDSLKVTSEAVTQIFILGAIGFFLVKKGLLGETCLDTLSRLTINVTLPLLMFCQLVKNFSFSAYPDWWIFPLLSVAITAFGLAIGALFCIFIKGQQHKLQFLNLVAFQNSGYLPLALIIALLPKGLADTMLVYLVLFLLGFNLVMFSFGVYILAFNKEDRFDWKSLFSPPVAATLIGLLFVAIGWNRLIPAIVLNPLKLVGDCSLPLAIIVVGGSLAQIHLGRVDIKAITLLVIAKLIILPALWLALAMKFRVDPLIGLLILIELAVPSAVTLSAIIRSYNKEDLLVSQGIFFSHLAGIITLPIFLSLYFTFVMIK